MRFSTILSSGLALGAAAQNTTTVYTEPKSGVTVTGFVSDDLVFGIALPETPGSDFIGVLVGAGTGWAGVSLAGPMTKSLLFVGWPSGQDLVSSFRQVSNYTSPPVITGSFSAVPIPSGTYVNSTHYTYTFLCKSCITGDSTSFSATADTAVLGWALSTKAPSTPASASTPLNKHQTQGNFGVDITSAKSAQYDTWAALAKAATPVKFAA